MSNNPLVSVIVTTKNEGARIETCLESIAAQSYKNIELIVVDNNSSDNTKNSSKKFTSLVFNKGPERSVQRNFGAEKAKGKYIIYLDADMTLTKDVIKECVERMKGQDNKEKIGGIIIPEVSVGSGFWAKVKAFERSFYVGDDSIEAARFFDKAIFWDSGGFDERITGPEDWDVSQRVKKRSKIERVKAEIIHHEGKVSFIGLLKKKFYYGKGVVNYLKTNSFYATRQQMVYFLRPTFYKNWKKFFRNPLLTCGTIWLLFFEQLAGFLGFLSGNIAYSKKAKI